MDFLRLNPPASLRTQRLLSRRSAAAMATCLGLLAMTGCADPVASADAELETDAPASLQRESAEVREPTHACTVSRDPDAIVAGTALGDCIATAMIAAGTGVMVLEGPDMETTTTQYQFRPRLTVVVGNDTMRMVVTDSSGWARGPDGRWLQEDGSSSNPAVKMATATLKGLRATMQPAAIAGGYGVCPEWVSEGLGSVEGEEFSEYQAFAFRCAAPYQLAGITVTRLKIWVDSTFLPIKAISSSQSPILDSSTVSHFSAWGEPIDIPDIATAP